MRTKRLGYLALTVAVTVPAAAVAHPGQEYEIGMAHVLTSVPHAAAFLLAGAIAGILMSGRQARRVIAASIGLTLLLLLVGALHAAHDGILFGLETVLAGAVLALAAAQIAQPTLGRARSSSEAKDKRPGRAGS